MRKALITKEYAREVRWVACWAAATGHIVFNPNLPNNLQMQIARWGLRETIIRRANATSRKETANHNV